MVVVQWNRKKRLSRRHHSLFVLLDGDAMDVRLKYELSRARNEKNSRYCACARGCVRTWVRAHVCFRGPPAWVRAHVVVVHAPGAHPTPRPAAMMMKK